LFGALQHTSVMPELQITQEYLGQATQLVFLAPLYKECLESDTYAKGPGSTVARVIDGELFKNQITAIAGVANIGNEPNWCGHPFAQANWYAFGRLAWNYHISSKDIAEEWLRMTYSNDTGFLNPVCNMMLTSREAAVNYMTPLGLHHIMGYNHHYGPAPWFSKGRADWTCVYYHRADSIGLGFDRSTTGSNAVSQYYQPVMQKFNDLNSCPDSFLLWFHHVPWDYKMKSGRTMWNELCFKYYLGVDQVAQFQNTWEKCKPFVTGRQFEPVKQLLEVQHNEACFWRDACVLYFQTFSKRPLPDGFEKPKLTLDEIMKIEFKYVPGINN
jgi:alpha-glucuronidase